MSEAYCNVSISPVRANAADESEIVTQFDTILHNI
jgi:hypothetical protein